jgi:hypothetical protein
MKRIAIGAAIGAGVAILVSALIGPFAGDDEAPIIVKNGTMKMESGSGTFVADGNEYSHETRGDHKKDLWVKVFLTQAVETCTATETRTNRLSIEYNNGAFTATLQPKGSLLKAHRTKITPKDSWKLDRPYRLIYPPAGGSGFITKVTASGWRCELTAAGQLEQINICSSSSSDYCKE